MKTHLLGALALLPLLGCSSNPATTSDAGATDAPPADVVAQDVARDVAAPQDVVAPADARDVSTADVVNLCEGLGPLCHGVDPGSGPLHDCHEGGHDGDPVWCEANAARCRALCIAAAADGGAHDHDAGSTADAAHAHDAGGAADAAHAHDAGGAADAAHAHDAGGAADVVAADAHVH